MPELKPIGWYASRISPYLPKEALKPVPGRLWIGAIYLGVILTSYLLIVLFKLNVWINLLLAVIIGNSFAALGFLGHEILHGTVIRLPWLRDLLGAIAFLPLGTGAKLWRKWHNGNHHLHTQNQQKDPDAWPSIEKIGNNSFLIWIYKLPLQIRSFFSFSALSISFTLHSFKMLFYFLKEFNTRNKVVVLLQFVIPIIVWGSMLVLIGPLKWFFAYLLPFFIANLIVMAYIATNHRLNPIDAINDPLANSLSVTVPKWVDVLHFNFSYHTEHHLFPGMNPKYYPLIKEQILLNWPEKYNEMPMQTALIALWKTPRVYFREKDLIDPQSGKKYGSLGYGLNPTDSIFRKLEL